MVELELHEAKRQKWDLGRQRHGNGPFRGHPGEEAFEECLDLLNYLDEWKRQGADPAEVDRLTTAVERWARVIQSMVLRERARASRAAAAGAA